MAVLPASPYIDEEMRRALSGLPPAPRPPGVARLPGAPPVAPMQATPAAAVVPPPAGPASPHPWMRPTARPESMDPAVAEYAARLTGDPASPDSAQMRAPAMDAAREGLGRGLEHAETADEAEPDADADDDPNTELRMIDAIASGLSQHRTGRAYDPTFWQGVDARREAKADKRKLEAKEAAAKALALEEADPGSERSMRARAPHAPLLKQLGLTDEDIAALSAADIKQMTAGGNVAMTVAKAKQKQAELDAKKADEAAALEEKRKYDDETWQKRNDITSKQAMDRAQTMAGISTNRMVQGALLADELAGKRQAAAASQRAGLHEQAADEAAKRKIEGELRAAEQKEANEEVALKELRAKLAARDPNEKLPGQQGAIKEAVVTGASKVLGGTGRSSDDSRLDNDLTALGLQAYMNKAHNAPNSEREQTVANNMFRGNGTAGSAVSAIDARLAEIEKVRKARAAAAAKHPTGAVLDPDEAALGIEEEGGDQ